MSPYSLRALSVVGMIVVPACHGACCAPPPGGFLQVTTVTAGANIDPDGYTLVVKPQVAGRDSLARTIAVNETITWEFEPVTSAVTLEDVQPNCLVSGDNPRLLTLIKGDTMSTTFTLSCS